MCREKRKSPQGKIWQQEGRKPIMHAVNKRLICDMIHLQHKTFILCSNYTKPCYDRIVHSVVSISNQRLVMPEQSMKCMLGTLQDLEYHTRTYCITLESSVNNNPPITFQGFSKATEQIQLFGCGLTMDY